MNELTKLTIKEARDLLLSRKISAVEVANAHIAQMDAVNNNAYITKTKEIALKAAEEADTRFKHNEAKSLDGIIVAVKDLFCTKDVLTTSASKMLSNFTPTYESTVTSKLFAAGASMIGKTNMDEFAMGSANITSYFGPVINPWRANNNDQELVPGGSSGGSAAAVASYSAFASLGSDTGGSIRQPASFCGIVGIKPTYGRCSRYGMIAFASSLDQAGVFARNVDDASLVLESIMGGDAKDSTSAPIAVPNLREALNQGVKGMRIGIPKEYDAKGLSPEIRDLWMKTADLLKQQGAEIIDINLPNTEHALSVYYIIAPAEASSNLARYDGVRYGLRETEQGMSLDEMYEATRASGFGKEVKRRIMIGTYVLSAGFYDSYYAKAQRLRSLISEDFKNAFAKVDMILAPTTPSVAFPIDYKLDPVEMYLNDIFTIPASLAGLPCMTVPAGLSSTGLPIGMQLIGKAFDEVTLLKTAKAIEIAANFKLI